MNSVRLDTISGFNSFLEDQKKIAGKCTITLLQFDTQFKLLASGEDIQSVQPLTESTYVPGGDTALLDAIARTIITTGQRLSSMPEHERPARVVVVIWTDGEENSSVEFKGKVGHGRVMGMIKEQTEKWKWQFLFMGANQDAIQTGADFGIAACNSMSYASNAAGTSKAFAAVTSNLRSYREADPADVDKLHFSQDQRQEQYAAGANDSLKSDENQAT